MPTLLQASERDIQLEWLMLATGEHIFSSWIISLFHFSFGMPFEMRQIVCFLWHCARQLHQAQRLFLWFSNFALTFVCNHFRAHTYTMLWPISWTRICVFRPHFCVLRPNSCEGMMAPTTESNCFATFYHPRVSTTHPLVKVENCEISLAAIGIFPTGEGFKIKEK